MIHNSVGTKMFRNFYICKNKKIKDAVINGRLSCAFFVSNVLNSFGLIKGPHLTVKSTIKDMEEYGWIKIKRPKIGAVISWEEKIMPDKKAHGHLGFYIGNNKAVSNSFVKKTPAIHGWKYRPILDIYYNKKLDK